MPNSNAKYEKYKAGMLENIQKMICESWLLRGLEIWGVDGGWEQVIWVQDLGARKC